MHLSVVPNCRAETGRANPTQHRRAAGRDRMSGMKARSTEIGCGEPKAFFDRARARTVPFTAGPHVLQSRSRSPDRRQQGARGALCRRPDRETFREDGCALSRRTNSGGRHRTTRLPVYRDRKIKSSTHLRAATGIRVWRRPTPTCRPLACGLSVKFWKRWCNKAAISSAIRI